MKNIKRILYICSLFIFFGCSQFDQRMEERFPVRIYGTNIDKNREFAGNFIKINGADVLRKDVLGRFKGIDPSELDDIYIQWKRIQVISQKKDDIYIIFGFKSSEKKFKGNEVLFFLKKTLEDRARTIRN